MIKKNIPQNFSTNSVFSDFKRNIDPELLDFI